MRSRVTTYRGCRAVYTHNVYIYIYTYYIPTCLPARSGGNLIRRTRPEATVAMCVG